jgi:AraC-like DNA-binding protein
VRVEHREDGTLVSGFLDASSGGQADAFDTVLVRAAHPYRAEMRLYCLGALNACEVSGDHQVGVLPVVSPATRGDRHTLGLMLTGHGTLEQCGRLASLTPGNLVIYRGRRPFQLELTSPYQYFMIDLPPEGAGFLRQADAVIANPQLPQLASGRILAATLAEIAGLAARMGPLTRQEMGEHIISMLRTLMHEASQHEPAPSACGSAVLDRTLNYIEQHLDRALSPEMIATAQHISVRYLHALFKRQDDTVGHHIRRRRMDRIRRDLADSDLAHLSASAVAARWGIQNASHFSKLFRAEFGLSPSEFRQAIRSDPARNQPAVQLGETPVRSRT